MLKRILLTSGIVALGVYVLLDVLGGLNIPGYSFTSQTISEESAIGVVRPPLLHVLAQLYTILTIAFGIGVYDSAEENPALRRSGLLLVLYGLSGFLWMFFPMSPRGAERTFSDTGHIGLTILTGILTFGFMGFAAAAFHGRFRFYTIATILAVALLGVLTGRGGAALAANQPTPLLGLYERLLIYAYMTWMAVLAMKLIAASRRVRFEDAALGQRTAGRMKFGINSPPG
ncbi:MAG TPA: DUF998 domain-containing protein [Longimicrobiales bacterium]